MKKRIFNFVFLLVLASCSQVWNLCIASSTQDAPSVKTFVNERMDFTLEYPDLFQYYHHTYAGGEQIIYASKDGRYALVIRCEENSDQKDGKALLADHLVSTSYLESGSEKSGPDFYTLRHNSGCVMDGYKRNYYKYGFVTKDEVFSFDFHYPDDKDDTGINYVELGDRIAASIKQLDPGIEKTFYHVKDKALYYGTKKLEDAKLKPVNNSSVNHWVALDGDDPGVYFFDDEGFNEMFIGVESGNECKDLFFSEEMGMMTFVQGPTSSPFFVTYEIYWRRFFDLMATFNGILGEFQWLDDRSFVATKCEDDIREGASFKGMPHGLRLSVICSDVFRYEKEPKCIKNATDKQNFSFKRIDAKAKKIFLTKEYVNDVKDWADEGKIQSQEITIPYPSLIYED